MLNQTVLAVSAILVLAGQASGQLSSTPYQRSPTTSASRILNNPVVSPYLALADLDGTGNIGQNYRTLVQPQVQSRSLLQRQQQSINSLRRNVTSMSSPAMNRNGARITGHPTRFQAYGRYYPGLGR